MVGQELWILVRETPGDGEKLELSREFAAECHQTPAEVVLAGKHAHA